MKRLFLATLMLLSGVPADGEWVKIATDDQGMTAYVDLDTIRHERDLVKMWALVDIETAQGDSFLSREEQVEYDCTAKRHRLLAGSWYSEHMGKGRVDAIDSHESKWNPLEPDKKWLRLIGQKFRLHKCSPAVVCLCCLGQCGQILEVELIRRFVIQCRVRSSLVVERKVCV